MTQLVLSIFPGIDLLGTAFEEEGFCVVRGPDILWGGDIRRFHPPAGCFDGVIGGPPCQRFSRLAHLVRHVHGEDALAPDLIPEFERCVRETQPGWFLMEEVPDAPLPSVPGYAVHDQILRDVWVGGRTSRLRRFSFGTQRGWRLDVEMLALHCTQPEPAVLAQGGKRSVPVAIGGTGKRKRAWRPVSDIPVREIFRSSCQLQGLPDGFDLPGMTVSGKMMALGNAVPMPMGRAIAKAVSAAMARPRLEAVS